MDNLVTIAAFTFPHQAAIVKGRLESEGINCYLKDEFTIQVSVLHSNAVGGVKLQVMESDEAIAKMILNDTNYAAQENETESSYDNNFKKNDLVACTNCGSTDVFKEKISATDFITGVLSLGFLFLIRSKRYHCFNCNTTFRIQ
jgi:DNA-directed RNA polymerase subunit RPC12/RpoP